MRIYVLPISGGAFPVQLGLLAELCDFRASGPTELPSGPATGATAATPSGDPAANITPSPRPDLVLGSSGGNVAAYIALAATWTTANIEEIVKPITNKMFVSSWWPWYLGFMPSWLIGSFRGSFYARGNGAFDLFKRWLTSESVRQTEMWTGTMNRTTGRGQLFCNRSSVECILRPRTSNTPNTPNTPNTANAITSMWVRNCMEPVYMSGDLQLIADVTLASASIPVFVPEQTINGQNYVDGGTMFSSPLTALSDRILDLGKDTYHIDYISSFDLDAPDASVFCHNVYANGALTVDELIKSLCVQDRLVAIDFLRSTTDSVQFLSLEGGSESLSRIETIRTWATRSVLELYPAKNSTLDLTAFNGNDIVTMMRATRKNYRIRFWWNGPADYCPLRGPQENP